MRIPDRKTLRRLYLRVMRHPGSPQRTGRGVAIGLLVAFLVPFTFHMAIAFVLAVLFRGGRLVAMGITWVSNPLTIPVIYPIQCYLGSYLVGRPLSHDTVVRLFSGIFREPSLGSWFAIGKGVMIPFFAGGLLIGGMAATAGYTFSVFLVTRFRDRKEIRRRRRSEKLSLANTAGENLGMDG